MIPAMARDLDLALVGATGFTGRLTARHLAGRVPPGARWALPGGVQPALEEVRDDSGTGPPRRPAAEVVTVDAHDEAGAAAAGRACPRRHRRGRAPTSSTASRCWRRARGPAPTTST